MNRHQQLIRAVGDDYNDVVPYMGYNGVSSGVIKDSFAEFLKAELEFLGFTESSYLDDYNYCCNHVSMFVDEVWRLWSTVKSASIADTVADRMKMDYKSVERFVFEAINHFHTQEEIVPDYCYVASNMQRDTKCASLTLCEKCPYYVTKKFYLCPIDLLTEDILDVGFYECNVKAFRHIWIATLRIWNFIQRNSDCITIDPSKKITNLLFAPASVGKIYEMTNPVEESLVQSLIDKKEQLETPPVQHSAEEWEYFNRTWEQLSYDISQGVRYVRSWHRAIQGATEEVIRNYNPDIDRTFSPKASSHKIRSWSRGHCSRRSKGKRRKRKQSAFLVSALEQDTLASNPLVKEFYKLYDVQLHYNENPDEDLVGDWSEYTVVCNKGKRKLRGIRLAEGPVQDVCLFLEKKDKAIFDKLGTSCRRDQSKGYKLGVHATKVWYEYKTGIRPDFDECPSLYNTDFTDATDTLNQDISYKFDTTLYNEEIANYWKVVSSTPFTFNIPSRNESGDPVVDKVKCSPAQGQPQGVHRSFTQFDGKHQHIAAQTMTILAELKDQYPDVFENTVDYRNTPVEYCFAILGDDNGFWSIKADPVINKDIFPFFDENHHGGAMYQVYVWLCKMHNWYFNPDKATITTPSSEIARWEFAKVTAVNGKTVTAPPFRMVTSFATRIGVTHRIVKPLAFALWRNKTLQEDAPDYIDFVIRRYSDNTEMADFMYQLMHGSYFRNLKNLEDRDLIIDDVTRAVTLYAFIQSSLRTGLISLLLNERKVEDLSRYGLDDLIWNEYDEALFAKIESENHKLRLLEAHNTRIHDLVQQTMEFDNVDSRIISLYVNAIDYLDLDQDRKAIDRACELIISSHDVLDDIHQGLPVDMQYFIDSMLGIKHTDLDAMDYLMAALLTRGTSKRPTSESTIGFDAWRIYRELYPLLTQSDTVLVGTARASSMS